MDEAMTIFLAGIGGVFTGMTMLYLAILLIVKGANWSIFSKESK